ncbi:MAG: tRNA pseudouridine synthase A, partial [Chitinispirillaceae bacterium]|nr:tRNA pseudouridine synthase A [Chitinispirillaceae bacterium]
TDAGVHARAQGAHFDYDGEIDIPLFTKSMNAILPPEIAIYNITPVKDTFHARFSALKRKYSYFLASRKLPLLYKRAWMIKGSVDWDKITEEINYLKGEHDFSSFCASGSDSDTKICKVSYVSFEKRDGYFVFSIEADRFLYKMVRSIVGTLVDIGRGKLSRNISEIIEKKDRKYAGMTAPAWGLVLENVIYAEVE